MPCLSPVFCLAIAATRSTACLRLYNGSSPWHVVVRVLRDLGLSPSAAAAQREADPKARERGWHVEEDSRPSTLEPRFGLRGAHDGRGVRAQPWAGGVDQLARDEGAAQRRTRSGRWGRRRSRGRARGRGVARARRPAEVSVGGERESERWGGGGRWLAACSRAAKRNGQRVQVLQSTTDPTQYPRRERETKRGYPTNARPAPHRAQAAALGSIDASFALYHCTRATERSVSSCTSAKGGSERTATARLMPSSTPTMGSYPRMRRACPFNVSARFSRRRNQHGTHFFQCCSTGPQSSRQSCRASCWASCPSGPAPSLRRRRSRAR